MQVENTSRDERLKSADIIISSPYTRALQTAQMKESYYKPCKEFDECNQLIEK